MRPDLSASPNPNPNPKRKLGTHKKALEEAGDQGLPFTKEPLVFETTGAMGEETHSGRSPL